MKKLKVIDGGIPLKIDDLDLLQDACFDAVQAILGSLLPDTTEFILTGCVASIEGTDIIVSAGVIYVDGEIYFVPEATFTYDSGKQLYVEEDFSTSENRTFHDTTTHDVWDLRVYQFGYAAEIPDGAIPMSTMFTLRSLLDSEITSSISGNADLVGIGKLAYLSGFTKATAYDGIRLEGNSFNGYMLLGAFTATFSAGKLATLPEGMRPTGDLVGFFFNRTVTPGIIKIQKDGDIYISGASTTGVNYLSFQFFMRFVDPILYSLPESGGAAPPDGDS